MQEKDKKMEEIYLRNHRKIYDFLYKYTNNGDTAMELMQDTFLKFFENYRYLNLSEEKTTMLLYSIARNTSINFAKKFSTKKEIPSDLDNFTSSSKLEAKEEMKDLEERLYSCLQLLPEEQKTVILLRNIEELTLIQIAEVMGLSISSVSRLLVKATAHLLEIAEQKGIKL